MVLASDNRTVWGFYDRVHQVSDVPHMAQLLDQETDNFGYDKFAFFSFRPGSRADCMCSEALPLEGYLQQRAFKNDPILRRAERSVKPISWNTHRWDRPLAESERTVLSILRDLGIDCGVSVPIHGPGLRFNVLCLSGHGVQQLGKPRAGELEGALHLLGAYVASIFHGGTRTGHNVALTKREVECLSWTAEGKTAWETGKILSISERTVRYHLSNAMQKLNTSSKYHAVLKALSTGILHF